MYNVGRYNKLCSHYLYIFRSNYIVKVETIITTEGFKTHVEKNI